MKSNIKETPVTISGFTIGRLLVVIIAFFKLFFNFLMPTAANVPIIVAKIDAIIDITNVLNNAFKICVSLKSSIYHLKVNPENETRLLDSLNEKNISINIGRYKNKKISKLYILYDFFILVTS